MSTQDVYQYGYLHQRWDDGASTYTEYDGTGAVTLTRAYTPQEVTDAQARATAVTRWGNLATLWQQAQNAIATNQQAITDDQTYQAIGSPSNLQVVNQVALLTQHDIARCNQNNKIIRVLVALLKGDLTVLDQIN